MSEIETDGEEIPCKLQMRYCSVIAPPRLQPTGGLTTAWPADAVWRYAVKYGDRSPVSAYDLRRPSTWAQV
jgi:hypothetical protein